MMFKSDDTEFAKLLNIVAREKQSAKERGRQLRVSEELKIAVAEYMDKTRITGKSLAEKIGVSGHSVCRWYNDYGQKAPLPSQPPLPPIEKPVPKSCGMIELDYKGVKFSVRLDQLKSVLKEIAE